MAFTIEAFISILQLLGILVDILDCIAIRVGARPLSVILCTFTRPARGQLPGLIENAAESDMSFSAHVKASYSTVDDHAPRVPSPPKYHRSKLETMTLMSDSEITSPNFTLVATAPSATQVAECPSTVLETSCHSMVTTSAINTDSDAFDSADGIAADSDLESESACETVDYTYADTGHCHRRSVSAGSAGSAALSTASASTVTLISLASDQDDGESEMTDETAPERAVLPNEDAQPSCLTTLISQSQQLDSLKLIVLLPVFTQVASLQRRNEAVIAEDAATKSELNARHDGECHADDNVLGYAAVQTSQVRSYRPDLYQVATLVKREGYTSNMDPKARGRAKKETAPVTLIADFDPDLLSQHEKFHNRRKEKAAQRSHIRKTNRSSRNSSQLQPDPDVEPKSRDHWIVAEAQLDEPDDTEANKSINETVLSDRSSSTADMPDMPERKKRRSRRTQRPRPCPEPEQTPPMPVEGQDNESKIPSNEIQMMDGISTGRACVATDIPDRPKPALGIVNPLTAVVKHEYTVKETTHLEAINMVVSVPEDVPCMAPKPPESDLELLTGAHQHQEAKTLAVDVETQAQKLLTRSLEEQQQRKHSQHQQRPWDFVPWQQHGSGPWAGHDPVPYRCMRAGARGGDLHPTQLPMVRAPRFVAGYRTPRHAYSYYPPSQQHHKPQSCSNEDASCSSNASMSRSRRCVRLSESVLARPPPGKARTMPVPYGERSGELDYWATRCWGFMGYVSNGNRPKPWYLQPLVYEEEKRNQAYGRCGATLSRQEQEKWVFRKYGL